MSVKPIGYGQYCPIAHALEVLGERWSLLIVRDLLTGNHRFNDIARSEPGLSRTLLSKRLRQLEAAGIVSHVGDEYRLTDAGEDLRSIVFSLGEWGAKWAFGEPRAGGVGRRTAGVVDAHPNRHRPARRAADGPPVPVLRRPPPVLDGGGAR